MEGGLKLRQHSEVDRIWSLFGRLYEVAEVAFLRARSHSGLVHQIHNSPTPLPSPHTHPPGNRSHSQILCRKLLGQLWVPHWA